MEVYVVSVSHHYESHVFKVFKNESDAKACVALLEDIGKKQESFNQAGYETVDME